MTGSEQSRLSRLFERVPQGAAAVAVVVGILVLFGWVFDVALLRSAFSGLVAMKANTAAGFILAGVSLWTAGARRRLPWIVSRLCAGAVLLLGLLVMAEYLSGANFGIDQLLVRDLTSLPGDIPGRMAVSTAACFAALGTALMLLSREKGGSVLAVHALATVPILVAGAALVSYGYDIEAFLRVKLNYTPMALHTAAVFVVLGLGIVSARPDFPFRRTLTSDSAAGSTARRFLPAAVGLQLVMGWLLLKALQTGHLSEAVGLALFAVANIAGLGALIQWNAVRLYRADAQRRLAEEALHKYAEEIEDLYNRAPIGYHSVDRDGTIVRINDTELAWLGYTREEVVGRMNFADLLTPESLKTFRETFAQSKARGWVHDLEYDMIRKDGTILPVLLNATAVRDAQGNFVMSRSTIYDITERKKLEAKLKRVSAYTRSLIEASPDPLVTISAEGKVTDVNEATIRATGISREALLGSDFSSYFTEPDKARAGYQEVFAKGVVTDYPLALRHASGSVMEVLYNASVYRNEKGEVAGVFAAARDVTRAQRAEKLVRERVKELQAFFHLSELAARKDFPLDRLCQELANVLPGSWQYPETACARIVIGGNEFRTANFGISEWMQAAPVKILGAVVGKVEVGYLEQKPEEDEGPFLKEERQLIAAIAERVGQIAELKRAEEALKQASAYTRSLIEASLDPLVTISGEGKIMDVNQATEKLTGFPRERLIGSDFSDYFTEPEKARQGYQRVLAEGFVTDYPLALRNVFGRVTEVLYNATVFRNEAGEVQGVFAAARDITERKRAEEALQESEERFHAIFDWVNDAIFIHDMATGAIVDVNRRMCEMYGYSRDEALKHDINAFSAGTPPYTQQDALQWLAKAARGEPQTFEWLAKDTAGRLFWVEVAMRSARLAGKDRILVSVRDISERKQTEQALQESEERYRSLVAALFEGVMLMGADGAIRASNTSAEQILGLTVEQMAGRTSLDPRWRAVHEDGSPFPGETHPAWVTLQTGEACHNVIMGVHKPDGSLTWISINSQPLYGPGDAKPYAVVASFADITERKLLEQELQRQALTDPLTGAANRRHFQALAEQELHRFRRFGHPLSLLMVDIDHFKQVNDSFGHQVGDLVLQQLVQVCRNVLRDIDTIARVGGEEFVALLPETGPERALQAAERLRRAVETTEVANERGEAVRFTVSIGVATLRDNDGSIETAVGRADHALYQAKETGRNRVCCEEAP